MRSLLALLAVWLVSAPALAGTEEQPEVTDAEGDAGAANAFGDIVAAWLTEERGDLVATIKVASLPDPPVVGDTWMMLADVDGRTWAWGVFASGVPEPFFFYAPWERGGGPAGPWEPGAGTLTPGSPGYITATIPLFAMEAEAPGAVLAELTAVTELCVCGFVDGQPVPPESAEVIFDSGVGADYVVGLANATAANATAGEDASAQQGEPLASAATQAPAGPAARPAPGADALLLPAAPAFALALRRRG